MSAVWRTGTCHGCGHAATDRDLLGVAVGLTTNVVLIACGACRGAYAATGRISLMHAPPLLTDVDITAQLHARGYVDERGQWPASGAAS